MSLLTKAGLQLVLDYEVGGGEAYYNKFLRRPTWPGGASGVTIAIGYDLGYNTKKSFTNDWQEIISENDFVRLSKTLGVTGIRARDLCKGLKDITIEWEDGLEVFNKLTVPKFYNLAAKAFPGFEELHPECRSALVSIVFNRGNALTSKKGNSRIEMKKISELTPLKAYKEIAQQVRAMKRLWIGKGLDGLLARREAEAKLIESCIA